MPPKVLNTFWIIFLSVAGRSYGSGHRCGWRIRGHGLDVGAKALQVGDQGDDLAVCGGICYGAHREIGNDLLGLCLNALGSALDLVIGIGNTNLAGYWFASGSADSTIMVWATDMI